MQPGSIMFLYNKMQGIFCGFAAPGFGCLVKNALFIIFFECHRLNVTSGDYANGMLRVASLFRTMLEQPFRFNGNLVEVSRFGNQLNTKLLAEE